MVAAAVFEARDSKGTSLPSGFFNTILLVEVRGTNAVAVLLSPRDGVGGGGEVALLVWLAPC